MLVAASAAVLTLGMMPTASAAPSSAPTDPGGGSRGGDAVLKLAADGRPATYVVRLEDPAVAAYTGGIDGLAPTSPPDGARIDALSAPVQRYEDYLLTQQAEVTAAAESEIGRSPQIAFRYTQALNGFATELTVEEARAVAGLPGVAAVTVDEILHLQTDVGPEWIGAPAIWGEPTAVPGEIDGSLYQPAAPERVLDGQRLRSGRLHVLDLDAVTTVPVGATGVVLNVQVTDARGTPTVSICPGRHFAGRVRRHRRPHCRGRGDDRPGRRRARSGRRRRRRRGRPRRHVGQRRRGSGPGRLVRLRGRDGRRPPAPAGPPTPVLDSEPIARSSSPSTSTTSPRSPRAPAPSS